MVSEISRDTFSLDVSASYVEMLTQISIQLTYAVAFKATYNQIKFIVDG